jgi:hypothetical protein
VEINLKICAKKSIKKENIFSSNPVETNLRQRQPVRLRITFNSLNGKQQYSPRKLWASVTDAARQAELLHFRRNNNNNFEASRNGCLLPPLTLPAICGSGGDAGCGPNYHHFLEVCPIFVGLKYTLKNKKRIKVTKISH